MARFAIVSVTFAALAGALLSRPKPRGFVIFFLDDHGYGDFNVEETPHLNDLAAGGLTFNDFHSAFSVCTPSRAGLLTGRLAPRTGVGNNFGVTSSHGLALSEITIADMLNQANYTSHMVGKWHLGHHSPYSPTYRGFQTWYGLPYSGDMGCIDSSPQGCDPAWDRSHGQPACPALCRNTTATAIPLFDSTGPNCSGKASCNDDIAEQPFRPTHLNEQYAERAVQIINEHGKSGKPFFLYFAFAHTHTPLAYNEKQFGNASSRPGRLAVFGNTLAEVDNAVGRVMSALRENGLEEQTLVLATSDNGPADLGIVDCDSIGSSGPFVGSWQKSNDGGGGGSTCKGTEWECGHHMMGIASWKGTILPNRTTPALASTLDVVPTFASLAGFKLPQDRSYDGIDLSSILFDENEGDVRRLLFHPSSSQEVPAMRLGKYKAFFRTFGQTPCRFANGTHAPSGKSIQHNPPLVFDIQADPGETTPIDPGSKILSEIKLAHDDFWADVKNTFRSKTDFSMKESDRPCSNPRSSCCRKANEAAALLV
eukprot:TRINITY_DN50327_c0_g1_i1.p1 TRINITY_DN50327_c0_g1~~TRINITY_DN50327_c0_g1_i1.p1  ORF type:complete len:538 (-),score=48.67 TRINITY_DN50327_c0_g1_i1:208-1821(-)